VHALEKPKKAHKGETILVSPSTPLLRQPPYLACGVGWWKQMWKISN